MEWTFCYPHLMTRQTQAAEQESVNSFICFNVKYHGTEL